jgi:hypothetical protein
MFVLYCVFMLCYFCAIALYGELRVLLREVKVRGLQKRQVTHISSTYFYYCISVFSSMHDRWNIQLFYKMLDPSNV